VTSVCQRSQMVLVGDPATTGIVEKRWRECRLR
jgi:hypothetical protein